MDPGINNLTGDRNRLPPPNLSWSQRQTAIKRARMAKGEHIKLYDREFWADPNGAVFVVAWKALGAVSGDPICDRVETRR